MKVLIGCDVDPILPPVLAQRPDDNVWQCLDYLDQLVNRLGKKLPPITWLIRSDESVEFSTGEFDSGFSEKRTLWRHLMGAGHECGWHMHLMSFDEHRGCFGFDPDPKWLGEARDAIAKHYVVHSTRTGWNYASNNLFNRLQDLGVLVDFSGVPGNIAWHSAGPDKVFVDWSRAPSEPYFVNATDYQRPGNSRLLEIPLAQFSNSVPGMMKRVAWRLRNGSYSVAGLGNKTIPLTDRWSGLPPEKSPIMAFFFHPEDLKGDGILNFEKNLELLFALEKAEFVTASAARHLCT